MLVELEGQHDVSADVSLGRHVAGTVSDLAPGAKDGMRMLEARAVAMNQMDEPTSSAPAAASVAPPTAAGGGGSKIMFVRGATTKREDEVADAARTANPDEIDLDEDDEEEEEDDDDEGGDESWGIAGMITCQISDCTVRLNRGLLPAKSVSANFGYMGMWHATLKPILPIGLYLQETIRRGGGQGGAHKARGWGKLMLPVGRCLVWEGSLHGDSRVVTAGSGVVGDVPPGVCSQ
ncbi:Pre-mRNA-splicing factor SYF1 [Chionoecetes opilio]|uniref:Pre-mRNA-splicing factor SYF1 n=1 Tax=Chionoecetes opilio TaxID=41210 RepID=A0A8J5CHB7_CHIOP|nr:Pre-mRNA-splicing factor SYF1 [Chionoecetes opilio]